MVAGEEGPSYVSRGAHKLAGALDAFGYDPAGKRALDAGASTGGFTDVLLRRGAAHVVAVDVGYGQLHERVAGDPRVTVVDRTNIRHVDPADIGGPAQLVVAADPDSQSGKAAKARVHGIPVVTEAAFRRMLGLV